MKELDIYKLSKGTSRNIKVGELSKEIIELLELNLKPQNINVWSTRIREHCEKHKNEYSSIYAYEQAIKNIPLILQEPDYVGIHKNGNIQYVKKLDDISLIGIQILCGGHSLLFRTIFPITESKLQNSIILGKLIKVNKRDTK